MKTKIFLLVSMVALVFSIRITSTAGEQINKQSFDKIRDTFNQAFMKELNALYDPYEFPGPDVPHFVFIPEVRWERKKGVWEPISFSIAAQVTKMIPRHPIERQLRYHGIWHAAFRDVSQEPNVARDAANASLNFWRATAQWEWARPHPLMNSSFISFLSRFENSFTLYEIHLGLGVYSDEPKLRLVFDYLPFPGEEVVDIKGMLAPFPFEQLVGRADLSGAVHDRASEKLAKQSFRILMEFLDLEAFRQSIPHLTPTLSPRTFSPSGILLENS